MLDMKLTYPAPNQQSSHHHTETCAIKAYLVVRENVEPADYFDFVGLFCDYRCGCKVGGCGIRVSIRGDGVR